MKREQNERMQRRNKELKDQIPKLNEMRQKRYQEELKKRKEDEAINKEMIQKKEEER